MQSSGHGFCDHYHHRPTAAPAIRRKCFPSNMLILILLIVSQFMLTSVSGEIPCEEGEDLDEYVDQLFRLGQKLLRPLEPFSGLIPNTTVELTDLDLILFLHKGEAYNLYTLERTQPAWIYCTDDAISLGLTVAVRDVRVAYKVRVIRNWRLLYDGYLEALITRPKVQVQFTQSTPPEDSGVDPEQRLEGIRIQRLGRIQIKLKGLGNLTSAVSLFLNGYLQNNMDMIWKMIRQSEAQAVDIVNQMIGNITLPVNVFNLYR